MNNTRLVVSKIQCMSKQTSILIIYTGGTIGMVADEKTGSYHPFDMDVLFSHVPELSRLKLNLETVSFEEPIDSSDFDVSTWIKLATIIEDAYNDHDGFVVLNGTDTMAYTASAMSFMLENLAKPVIITGSQLPMGVLRTDGKENLISAIEIAAARKEGKPRVQEVAIYFGSKLLRGNRAQKFNTEGFEAFDSFNYPPLADVGIHIIYHDLRMLRQAQMEFAISTAMDDNVGVLRLFPGMKKNIFEQILNTPDLKGLVLETFGSGNATSANWFVEALKKATDNGLIVVNVTQCGRGFVEQGKYLTSRGLISCGVISAADMTVEAAITKMMKLLGLGYRGSEFEMEFTRSSRGELTSYSTLS
ncbi:MAG: L-asparaginase [Gammaproteobacteria bacterium]